jgi:hypothetical protein
MEYHGHCPRGLDTPMLVKKKVANYEAFVAEKTSGE